MLRFKDFIKESNNVYDPDKTWEYEYIVHELNKGPYYIRRTIKDLKPIDVWVESEQDWSKVTKISNQQWSFIFHPKW